MAILESTLLIVETYRCNSEPRIWNNNVPAPWAYFLHTLAWVLPDDLPPSAPSTMFFLDLVDRTDEARREFESSSNVLDIVANGLSLERYRCLLLELYHVVWHFNPTCAAAASRIADEQREVRYFLYEHMNEEQGHERWVLNDLEVVGVSGERARTYAPSVTILGLNGYNYWAADRRHPCSVLGMIYALEIVASVYGGQMTAAISDSLMLEGDKGISFISSHATMDTEHLAELRIVLNGVEDSAAQAAVVESTKFNFHQFGLVLEGI